jgi:ankyrin repeat protein
MTRETAKPIVMRALTFAGTFTLSLMMVSGLPSVRAKRQRSFAQAAMDGSLRRLQLLHLTGADVTARGYCCAPLFLAAGQGRATVVRYLLDEGADVNAREKLGGTPLMEAAYAGYLEVIKELLFRGAEINAIGNDGTALDIAVSRNNAAAVDLLKHYGGKRASEIRK